MQSGVILAHRFTLVSEEDFDLEGATRWCASDKRLRRDVTAYALDAERGEAIAASVARISTVRDPRLARVIANGTETVENDTFPYVIVDRPRGMSLADALSERNLPPRFASAVVGSLARALVPLASRGIHHGAIRATAVTVSESGVPVLSGLGVDSVLASSAEEADSPSETADAAALVRLYVRCIAGPLPHEATVADLPDGLGAGPRALCTAVLERGESARLTTVVEAFPPDHGVLRGFREAIEALPLRPDAAEAAMEAALGMPIAEIVGAETLAKAAHTVDVASAASATASELRPDIEAESLGSIIALLPAPEPIVEAAQTIPEVPEVPEDERDLFDDLEAYEAIADEQNEKPSRSVWEALIEPLHRRWPDSDLLSRAYTSAHARAGLPGPIRTRLLLLAAGLIAIVIAWQVAVALLEEPVTTDLDRRNPPEQSYPAFTLSPSPTAAAEDG